MKKVFRHAPLYQFLYYCDLEKTVETPTILDCGAGGATPPLTLFHSHGYQTYGIEFNLKQIEKANAFAGDLSLNIMQGDMRKLRFNDNSFDFVYSYNSIFHMKKTDIAQSLSEMKRVLKPGGLIFVNFLSTDDFRCGEGTDLGSHQYEQMEDAPVIHAYFEYDEADQYLGDMTFVLKERRIIERIFEGERIRQGFIDYIARKN
ncbi:class I SAM-dependent methyltransferase [Fusibacter paucivorans]|uniref:Class I SAM-dependent methyltransferase n=1 Tax=Fusibacter paucivorans TaxID=76009 RepID=A0ABS5PU35_9FIRM|nr:class I SAM-dependent methyltransferase [Fusibacter paucivorans]MBS7528076.1 class I SAM-dependent methyltransferase [Fusibacter paucivorans]